MFINEEDLANRLRRLRYRPLSSVELVGEEKHFGYILVNKTYKLRIYISNVDKIMRVITDFLIDEYVLTEQANDRFRGMY